MMFLSGMSLKSIKRSFSRIIRNDSFGTSYQVAHDPKEEEMVNSFRELLSSDRQIPEKYKDYHTLLRFLRMRCFNLEKAREMFLKMLLWREEFGVDALVKEFKFEELDAVKTCYPHGFHGFDRSGRPLYIERMGLVDLTKLFEITTVDRYIKYHVLEQEKTLNLRYPACSVAAKQRIASTTTILDVKGVGVNNFSKPARELFLEIQKIDSNYYPETLNQLYIVNAGSGFRALWKILRVFFEARTLQKIQVLGSNYQSTLLEAIEPSNLPVFLGGTCTCPASGGCLLTDKGPWTDPNIISKLQGGYPKGMEAENERKDETENQRHVIDMTSFTQTSDTGRRISEKILELEAALDDTKLALEKLASKQQELARHVGDLKKLTSS